MAAAVMLLAAPQVVELPLGEKLGQRGVQVSGLTWDESGEGGEDDRLLFVTQSTWSDWVLLAATRDGVQQAIEGKTSLEVLEIAVENEPEILDFDGLEAAAVRGGEIFLLIEGRGGDAHLSRGKIEGNTITLSPEVKTITAKNVIPNLTCEALCLGTDKLWVFEEASCASRRQPARAYEIMDGRELAFEAVNDRITDATPLDKAGKFWVSAYEYRNELDCEPGDEGSPERLLELQYADGGIKATSRAIDLNEGRAQGAPARNWEGIARWDEKHLLVVNDDLPSSVGTTVLLVEIP